MLESEFGSVVVILVHIDGPMGYLLPWLCPVMGRMAFEFAPSEFCSYVQAHMTHAH